MQEVYESKAFKDYKYARMRWYTPAIATIVTDVLFLCSTDVALSAALEEMDREFEERKRLRTKSNSSSDADSFVSARSVSLNVAVSIFDIV